MSAFGADLARLARIDRTRLYDPGQAAPLPGGTTTLLYDPDSGRVERHFLSLAGTERNCAGGPTPWGSWLTCEETVHRRDDRRTVDHGWVFEVPAAATGPVDPVPLKALGRFNHEAAAVDPRTGVVYLTEDESDSLFYRLLPARPGDLRAGGRLQALALRDWQGSADTRNWNPQPAGQIPTGQALVAHWVDLTETDAPDGDLRRRGAAAGAARFARGEGLWFGHGDIYFCCTSGGVINAGQIFRYRPSPHEGAVGERDAPGQLELYVESTDRRRLDMGDNLTVSPWGDLLVCEDARTSANACFHLCGRPGHDNRLFRIAGNPRSNHGNARLFRSRNRQGRRCQMEC
jgi:secreted PhoX family phosphatase